MQEPLRFLLDQNFPEIDAVLDPHSVDRSVRFHHIRQWRPDLIEADTPDWLIYFEAELAGFTGLVTKDWHQSVQEEEAFAITHTKLSVVTWREPPDDPVVEWAMVIAYMPEIKKILAAASKNPPFVFLPNPTLSGRSTMARNEAIGILAKERGVSNWQVRREAKASILDYLTSQGLRQDLIDLAERTSRRRPPGSLVPPRPFKKKSGTVASPPLST